MPMYNLIEYSNNYSKASILQRYYKDDPNDNIVNSKSVRFKINVPKKTLDAGNTKDAKIAVLLKYLSSFEIWFQKNNYLEKISIKSIITRAKPTFRLLN